MDESAPKRRRVSPQAGPPSEDTTRPSKAPSSRPKHRSFASPAKSSLARHNSGVFERSRSRSTSPRKTVASRSDNAANNKGMAGASDAHRLAASEMDRSMAELVGDDSVRDDSVPNGSSAREQDGVTATHRPPSPTQPQPRPLPAPTPDGLDDLDPFFQRTEKQPPLTGFSVPARPEPELPPPADDDTTSMPPKGIHVSSPRGSQGKPKPKTGGSPLKVAAKQKANAESWREGPASNHGDAAAKPEDHAARRIVHSDTHQAKRMQVQELRSRVEGLKSDLRAAGRENERIYLMQVSGRRLASSSQDELLKLMYRRLVQSSQAPRSLQSKALLQTALDPLGLLPWGRPSQAMVKGIDVSANIKSHHPVTMSADEELPFLQVFTPFNITSSMSVLPSASHQPLRQRRVLTLRSRDLAGLFTAKLELVVDAMTLGIVELNILGLEPSARFELKPFVDKICSAKCNRSMQRNVGLVCWAMGDWYRVAVQRARFWQLLDERLGTKGSILASVETVRSRGQPLDVATAADTADIMRWLGQQAFEVRLPVASEDEAAIRLEWKIEFDWTGEAQSKVGILVGIPGKWRETDGRGVFAKLPKLFEQLVENQGKPEAAASIIAALLVGL